MSNQSIFWLNCRMFQLASSVDHGGPAVDGRFNVGWFEQKHRTVHFDRSWSNPGGWLSVKLSCNHHQVFSTDSDRHMLKSNITWI